MNRRLVIVSLIPLWFFVVGIGLCFLAFYENTPGEAATPPSQWPSESRIRPAPGRATLVMLTHPKCPCTRASVEELDKLMAHSRGLVDAYIVVVQPDGFPDEWVKGDILRNAMRIPGVSIVLDRDGVEAQRFRAATSGQVLLYSAEGHLLFRGGMTASRGHIGDNAGRSAVESLVHTGEAERDNSLVFGCPLFDRESDCRRKEE